MELTFALIFLTTRLGPDPRRPWAPERTGTWAKRRHELAWSRLFPPTAKVVSKGDLLLKRYYAGWTRPTPIASWPARQCHEKDGSMSAAVTDVDFEVRRPEYDDALAGGSTDSSERAAEPAHGADLGD